MAISTDHDPKVANSIRKGSTQLFSRRTTDVQIWRTRTERRPQGGGYSNSSRLFTRAGVISMWRETRPRVCRSGPGSHSARCRWGLCWWDCRDFSLRDARNSCLPAFHVRIGPASFALFIQEEDDAVNFVALSIMSNSLVIFDRELLVT